MQRFVDLTLNGIANGAIYAAVALSLVLIWRATRILNFAQAGMLMFDDLHRLGGDRPRAPGYWVGFAVALVSGLVLGRADRARGHPPRRGRAARSTRSS